MNNDGFVDLLTADTAGGTISVLLNSAKGSGLVNSASLLPIGVNPRFLISADLDSDGDKDLAVVVNDDNGDGVVRVIRNDLNEQNQLIFATAIQVGTGIEPALLFAGDINGDASSDLLAIGQEAGGLAPLGASASIAVLLNQGGFNPCPADIDSSGTVDIDDLLAVVNQWGVSGGPADITGDGVVNIDDLLAVINGWGLCP
jgi:hypothetical protein